MGEQISFNPTLIGLMLPACERPQLVCAPGVAEQLGAVADARPLQHDLQRKGVVCPFWLIQCGCQPLPIGELRRQIEDILDEVLGVAANAAGASGLTGTLTVRFRAPTPYGVPIRASARYTHSEGRRHFASGELAVDGEVTVSAEAVYVASAAASLARAAARGVTPHSISCCSSSRRSSWNARRAQS